MAVATRVIGCDHRFSDGSFEIPEMLNARAFLRQPSPDLVSASMRLQLGLGNRAQPF